MATYDGTSGDDVFNFSSPAAIQPGDIINGGSGTDTLKLAPVGDYDLSGVTLNSIEILDFTIGSNIPADWLISLTTTQLDNFTTVYGSKFRLTTGGTVFMAGVHTSGFGAYTLSDSATTLDFTGAINDYLINGFASGGFNVTGGAGNDVIATLEGTDTINGGGGDDVINSGGGGDVLTGGTGRDEFHAGDGNDKISVFNGDFVTGEVYDGGTGYDWLAIGSPNIITDLTGSTLTGIEKLTSMSDNTLNQSLKMRIDQVAGLSEIGDLNGIAITLADGGSIAFAGKTINGTFNLAAADTVFDLTGTGSNLGVKVNGNSGNDQITGTAFNDTLTGGAGNDVLTGGDGSDQLTGGTGRDEVHGGTGNDTIYVATGDTVTGEIYDGGADDDSLVLGANVDISSATVSGIETVYIYWQGSASMTAAQLQGFSHIATLNSSPEVINLTTGGTVVFSGSADTVTFNLATADTAIDLSGMTTSFNSFEPRPTVNGNVGNDTITGSGYADMISGGGGLDIFHAGGGDDNIIVANGDYVSGEVYDGGAGRDSVAFVQTGSLDVTGATFTALEVLTYISDGGQLTLTPTQLLGFSQIAAQGSAAFTLSTGGSLSFAGKMVRGTFNLAAADTVMDFSGATMTDYLLAVNGNSGNDTLIGNASTGDILNGGAGNDRLDGRGGSDILSGGLGDDTYVINSSQDIFFVNIIENAGEGNDTIEAAISYSLSVANVENVTLSGTNNINATGNISSNVLTGNSGSNRLDGLGGGDRMVGGLGNDTYVVRDASDVVIEDANQGNDTVLVASNVGTYVLAADAQVEKLTALTLTLTTALNLTGNAYSHDIQGNAGVNVLIGGAGADTLQGFAGNDRLDGGAGADTLYGGTGNDTYVVDNAGDVVVENASEGTDTVESSITFSLASAPNVENLTLTGTANINATGNALANVLTGNSGNNRLFDMGSGDTLIGGLGDDFYVVSDAATVIVEAAGGGSDSLNALVSYVLGAGVEIEAVRLAGTASINFTGNAFHQNITGNSGNNVIDGGGGADRMRGGLGDDTFIVRGATNVIVEGAGEGNDTVKAAVSYTLGAAAQIEHLQTVDATAATAINLTGNAYSHDIQGNAGANVLTGGAGNDVLQGFGGNDTLIGGGGNDVFVFDHGTGQDSVGDFVSGSDKLDLSAFGFADFAAVQAATHDVGGNAVIDLGSGDTVTLSGFLTAQLQSGDVVISGGGGGFAAGDRHLASVQGWVAMQEASPESNAPNHVGTAHLVAYFGATSLPAHEYVL